LVVSFIAIVVVRRTVMGYRYCVAVFEFKLIVVSGRVVVICVVVPGINYRAVLKSILEYNWWSETVCFEENSASVASRFG
jgi:hypothetical protein